MQQESCHIGPLEQDNSLRKSFSLCKIHGMLARKPQMCAKNLFDAIRLILSEAAGIRC